MIFREARIEDSEELDSLLTKLIDDERVNYDNSLEPTVVKDFYKNMLVHDDRFIYVCLDDERIVGYVYAIIEKCNHAKIDALYVENDYRNKKIASSLLNMTLQRLKSEHVETVEISVLSANEKAKYLYGKVGFVPFKETLKLNIDEGNDKNED